jgi:hypothetical protein
MLRAIQQEEEDKCCAFGLSTCRLQGSIEDQSQALCEFIFFTTTNQIKAFPTCCISGTQRMHEGTFLADGHSTGSQVSQRVLRRYSVLLWRTVFRMMIHNLRATRFRWLAGKRTYPS